MDLLEFDDLSLFKKISLDEETLMLYSKCGKYSFYVNFKDEIKGVDYYELAIATESSSGFINKSGTASVINKAVMDTLCGKVVSEGNGAKAPIKTKANNATKVASTKKPPFFAKKRGRK